MRKLTQFLIPLFGLTLFATGTAAAQTAPAEQATPAAHAAPLARGIGLGAEATLTGIVGATFVYDAEAFHVDALLGGSFEHNDSSLAVAGRLFFPLHRSQSADFSVGPGVGVVHITHDPDGDGPQARVSSNPVHVEGAAQIRAFLVPNVAVSATAGLGVVITDNNNSAIIGGQLGGAFGITYFFF
ncbi:MAG: hypothetical protein ABI627_23595 [Polyangiaceae bacterium]